MSALQNYRHIDRIAELEEEVRQLREILMPTMQFPLEFKLTKTEARVLICLYTRAPHIVSHERIHFSVWQFADVDVLSVSVHICKVRNKLRPFNIKIFNRFAEGYYLNEQGRMTIAHMLQEAGLPDPTTMKLGAR